MTNFWWILLALTGVIIVPLAFYAGRLLNRLQQQKRQQVAAAQAAMSALQAHDAKIFTSVALICQAMLAQQCELSEGCWRLSVLLESLKISGAYRDQYPTLFQLYDKIKHMSILGQRAQLPKQQRMKQDFDRLRFEAQLQDQISSELELLIQDASAQLKQLQLAAAH